MKSIGIDPGKLGALALLDDDGRLLDIVKMPATERDLLDVLRDFKAQGADRAYLERVHSSPQMGVVSAFTFGQGYGSLRTALAAIEIPFDEVLPSRWQATMKCRTKGNKNVTKRRAQELWPGEKIPHWKADALLLAEFGRRTA